MACEIKDPTNNPICSDSIQDLKHNAIIFDQYINSEEFVVPDRLGIPRKTWAGLEKDVQDALVNLDPRIEQLIAEKIIAQGGIQVLNKWIRLNDAPLSSEFLMDNLGFINFEMFGADPSGVECSAQSISDCFEYSKNKNIPIFQSSGVFRLCGSLDINIENSANLSGSLLVIDEWSGSFVVKNSEWVDRPDLIQVFNSNIPSIPNNNRWNGLNEENCAVRIKTDTPLYSYRKNIFNVEDIFISYGNGYVSSGFFYAIDGNITSVSTLNLSLPITLTGLNIQEDFSNRTAPVFIVKDSSNVSINDFKFTSELRRSVPSGYVRVNVINSVDVSIDGISAHIPLENDLVEYAYTLMIEDSYRAEVSNVEDMRGGWSAFANNNCKNVTVDDCMLSKIDFHKPCFGYLNITNTKVGNYGVSVFMIGDLTMKDCEYSLDANNYREYANIISSRGDAGGWCNGSLVMDNVKLSGRTVGHYNYVLRGMFYSKDDDGNRIPSGSPARSTFYDSITVRDMKINDEVSDSGLLSIFNSNYDQDNIPVVNIDGLMYKNDIILNNAVKNCDITISNLNLAGKFYMQTDNSKIKILDSSIGNISLIRGIQAGNYKQKLDVYNSDITILSSAIGNFTEGGIYNSTVTSDALYSITPYFKFSGSTAVSVSSGIVSRMPVSPIFSNGGEFNFNDSYSMNNGSLYILSGNEYIPIVVLPGNLGAGNSIVINPSITMTKIAANKYAISGTVQDPRQIYMVFK